MWSDSRKRSTVNEIRILYKTNTIIFIHKSDVPKGINVIYGSFVVDTKEHKEEREHTILTVGEDQIEYPGDKSTRTVGLTTAKILINGIISTKGAIFLVIDINNLYLNTPLEDSNKWSSTYPLCLRSSSTNIIFWNLRITVVSTSKFRNECMICPRRASSRTIFYSDDYL
jgi:hypothetical protein